MLCVLRAVIIILMQSKQRVQGRVCCGNRMSTDLANLCSSSLPVLAEHASLIALPGECVRCIV